MASSDSSVLLVASRSNLDGATGGMRSPMAWDTERDAWTCELSVPGKLQPLYVAGVFYHAGASCACVCCRPRPCCECEWRAQSSNLALTWPWHCGQILAVIVTAAAPLAGQALTATRCLCMAATLRSHWG
jgi:hypothetical protein